MGEFLGHAANACHAPKSLGVDGKLVADQLGHTLDVNQNVYTQTPVEIRQVAVNELEKSLQVI